MATLKHIMSCPDQLACLQMSVIYKTLDIDLLNYLVMELNNPKSDFFLLLFCDQCDSDESMQLS
jgi:hypothetical protein